MVSASLAFTAATYDDMYEFIAYKLYYEISDQTSTWETWADDATSNGTTEEQAAATKYSGRALTIGVDMGFIPAWTTPAFVSKWSGGCLEDHSSSAGGFCILETSDVNMAGTTTTSTDIYGMSGNTDTVQSNTNRAMMTFRLSDSQFESFKTAWEDTAIVDTNVNEKDGRCWYNNISGYWVDDTDSANIEYLDYASCALSGEEWTCQIYLRNEADQEDGYPAFITPGVVTGYWVASYIPGVEKLSYSEVTDFLVYDGAQGVTAFVGAVVAGIATLMF